MPTLSELKRITETILQDFPEIAIRYGAGDNTIVAPLHAIQHMLAEISRDTDISEIEPFTKSRDATILADASNKNILPLATACQHYISVKNSATAKLVIPSGRVIEDGQGRPWRLLQTVNAPAGQTVDVLVEQSEQRSIEYQPSITETFHSFGLKIQEELDLVSLSVHDQDGNIYNFVPKWMNTAAGERAVVLKTNSLREIILEFGDSNRFGNTLSTDTKLTINILESYGEVDVAALKEATLQVVTNNVEQKANIRFKPGGVLRSGADPLNIEEMRLLSSYPTFDDNAVFLGNFDFLVRKKFMKRFFYGCVWNEVVEEQNYGANLRNINKLFFAVKAKAVAEQSLLEGEITQLLSAADNLFDGRVIIKAVQERPFNLYIDGLVSQVHDVDALKEEIRTLLVGAYGKGSIASNYYLANGFNLQEIGLLLGKKCSAFQDRTSDFKLSIEDLSANPIKPHQWVYLTEASIHMKIQHVKGIGESRWSIL